MSNAGRAVFEAVGKFDGLRREADKTQDSLRGVRDEAKGIGEAVPRDGGTSAKGLSAIADRAGQLGDKFTSAGQSLSLKLTAPLTLLGGVAVKTFADFERDLTSAGAKADATAEQLSRMKDLALELGAETMFSAGEAAAAMDVLAAAGMDAEKAMAALPGVMKGAQASGEDLTLTAETIAKTMNAFNIEGDRAVEVADLFAQAANTTALGMEEIAYGIANAGEIGPRFGQSLEGTIAMLGRLVDMGVPAASAGVAIRSALTRLAAPAVKAQNIIDDLGIATRDASGNMLPLADLVENVSKAMKDGDKIQKRYGDVVGLTGQKLSDWADANGKTEAQAMEIQNAIEKGGKAFEDYALQTIFGVEGSKAFSLAMSDGKPLVLDTIKDTEKLAALQEGLAETMGDKAAKAWIAARTEQGKFTAKGADTVRALEAMGTASEGTADKFVEVFGETTAAHLDEMWGSLESLAIALVDRVAPALDTALDKATKFFNKVGEFADEHDWFTPLLVGVGLFLAALGPVLIVVGTLLKSLRTISKIGKGIGKVARFATGRGKTTAPVAAGGAVGDAAAQSVWWSKPMPVYITNASKTGGAGGKGTTVVGGTGAGSQAPWRGWGLSEGKPSKKERLKAGTRAVGRAGAGAAGAAGMGVAMGIMSGQSTGDIAKTAGLFAALELAIMGVAKASGPLGRGLLTAITWIGRTSLAVLGFIGRMLLAAATMVRQAAVIAGRWAFMAGRALVNAARMALAWTIGVIKPAAKALARMAVAAAIMVAKWVLMGVQALAQAARMAAAWLIAMGPVGWVIAAVIALALLIWKYWDKIKAWTAAAWEWVWDKIKWLADKIWSFFKTWSLPGLIYTHWEDIKSAFGDAVDWIMDKLGPFFDFLGKIGDAIGGVLGGIKDLGSAAIKKLPGMKTGGLIPGVGRGDKVPIMAEPGEFVVRRDVVRRPGVLETLQRWNAGSTYARSADVGLSSADLMRKAMSRGVAGAPVFRPAVASSGSGLGDDDERGGRDLTVIVQNPREERASESVESVLTRRLVAEGWTA